MFSIALGAQLAFLPFVGGVGTSEWLGTEATESCDTDLRTDIPHLPRISLNEAATPGLQQLERRRHFRLPGAGLRDERTDPIAAAKDCVAVEATNVAKQAR